MFDEKERLEAVKELQQERLISCSRIIVDTTITDDLLKALVTMGIEHSAKHDVAHINYPYMDIGKFQVQVSIVATDELKMDSNHIDYCGNYRAIEEVQEEHERLLQKIEQAEINLKGKKTAYANLVDKMKKQK